MRFIGFCSFQKVARFTLRVQFDAGTSQIIDFRPVLKGELYSPLQEPTLFNQVHRSRGPHACLAERRRF